MMMNNSRSSTKTRGLDFIANGVLSRVLVIAVGFLPQLFSLCAHAEVGITLETVGPMSSKNQAAWWSPIAYANDALYVSYLAPNSPEDDVFVAKRDASGTWTVEDTGFDSRYDVGHTQTSIGIDGDGFIHLFYGMHGDPISYAQSNQPNSVSGGFTGSSPAAFGGTAGEYTYPNLATTPNGDVYMIIRDRRDNYLDQTGRFYHFNNQANTWSELPPFAGQSGTTVYPDEVYADPSGDLHIIWEWALGGASGSRQYGSYARYSPEKNKFYKADGTAYPEGPVSLEEADIFQGLDGAEFGGHGFQSAKMTLDEQGRPIVAYSFSIDGTASGYEHRMARWTGSEWIHSTITPGPFDIDKSWVAFSDGTLRYYGTLSPNDPNHTGTDDMFVRVSSDLGTTWSEPIAVTNGKNIERPMGVTAGGIDYLYLPDINTGQMHVAIIDPKKPGPLKAIVHPATGEIMLLNDSEDPFAFDYYQLEGAVGSFDPNTWNSLDEQNIDSMGSGIGQSWDEASGSSTGALGEAFLLGSTTLDPGESISLGKAYNPHSGDESLTFTYRNANLRLINTRSVEFLLLGDMDGNGLLEVADVALFIQALTNRSEYLSNHPTIDPDRIGDFDGNELLDLGDVKGFQDAVTQALANSVSAQGVPEPSAAALCGTAALALATGRWGPWLFYQSGSLTGCHE